MVPFKLYTAGQAAKRLYKWLMEREERLIQAVYLTRQRALIHRYLRQQYSVG